MKTNKKALLTVLCALLLVVASVMGTLAYLTDSATVTNTFTVGKVTMTMDETDVDNSTEGENDRDTANTYKVYPGGAYDKDPILHIGSGSDDCWLFIEVTNDLAEYEADDEGKDTIAEQIVANGWAALDATNKPGVYYKAWDAESEEENNANVATFSNVYIKSDLNNEDLTNFNTKTVEVKAFAIQMAGFENNQADAYTAVKAEYAAAQG